MSSSTPVTNASAFSYMQSPLASPSKQFTIRRAIAILQTTSGYKCGSVIFDEYPNEPTRVSFDLHGIQPGFHACHVHEYGDESDGCESMGDHYNPFGGTHKDVNMPKNHLGDLGNIYFDERGVCKQIKRVNYLPLFGTYSIVGRGLVIHENIDDLGTSRNLESHKTGNSGKRIACGIIALSKPIPSSYEDTTDV